MWIPIGDLILLGKKIGAIQDGFADPLKTMNWSWHYGVNPKTETLGMNALPIKREDEWEIGDGIAGSSNSR